MVNEPTTSNHTSNTDESAGPSNGEHFTLYFKLTDYFKKSNINDRKFCQKFKYRSIDVSKVLKN